MVIRVKVYGRDDSGHSKVFGEITWDGKRFKLIPRQVEYRAILKEVLDHKIPGCSHNKKNYPELWIRNLYKLFSGSRLKCSPAVEV